MKKTPTTLLPLLLLLLVVTLSATVEAFCPIPRSSSIINCQTAVTTKQINHVLLFDEKAGETEAPAEPEAKQTNMMSQIKEAGTAGALSLFIWELAFWAISIPVAIYGFVAVSGSWPDFGDQDDVAKVGAEAFAFANVARLALPVRIGLALATTPWVKDNIVEAEWAAGIFKKEDE